MNSWLKPKGSAASRVIEAEYNSLCDPAILGFDGRMPLRSTKVDEELFADARRTGIDLDLIDTNLALSVLERWRQHDAALALILKLEQAKAVHDTGLQRRNR